MGRLSSIFKPFKRSTIRDDENNGRDAADTLMKNALKQGTIIKSPGFMHVQGSDNLVSVHSKRGHKGLNQDRVLAWDEFGCQADMMFCGIFDGHGEWGRHVSKVVRDTLPSSLLCSWQELLQNPSNAYSDSRDKKHFKYHVWRNACVESYAAVDRQLQLLRGVDCFNSGTTGLALIRQGDNIVIANVGDSRAVLGTLSEEGKVVALQLTTDFKPDLPRDAEEEARILQLNGRVFCLRDEPGVKRVWRPDDDSPGLAMSRAFGDYCVKKYGVTSFPEVTHRRITGDDRFIILATDGVWDVVSIEEAVKIVHETTDKATAAKRLCEEAARAWKSKRKGVEIDDISAICLFFHSASYD